MEQAYVSQGTSIDKGENARLSSFVGAIAIGDLIKTTLGPCGLDKILQSIGPNNAQSAITVTNDGATILNAISIDNAAAKVLVEIAKVQDASVGDGTTSVAVLASELLRQAETLIFSQHVHPQTICAGYHLARTIALNALEQQAQLVHNSSTTSRTEHLMQIARTTLSSKLLTHEKEHFATIAVQAVERLTVSSSSSNLSTTQSSVATEITVSNGNNNNNNQTNAVNLQHIQIIKIPGGTLAESYLEDGFLLVHKTPGVGQPTRIVNGARILLANTSMDTDKIKLYGSRVKVDSIDKVADIEQAEKKKLATKVSNILAHYVEDPTTHKKLPVNCFINRQLIYNYPETLFTAAGIMAIEHADFDGMERLAAVLGGDVVSTFVTPGLVTLGQCDTIEPLLIGDTSVTRFGGCKSQQACSIVLRGASRHVLDEAERSLHDALAVLSTVATTSTTTTASTASGDNKDDTNKNNDSLPRTVYGGGWSEVCMATAVDKAAAATPGKVALAMRAYAKALRALPTCVAENGGYDAAELISQLSARHATSQEGNQDSAVTPTTAGLDMVHGTIGDMEALGIRESYYSKTSVVVSASEAAEMILRVDDIIKAAPRRRDERGY